MAQQSKQARPADVWASGEAYEPYVGRWSSRVAAQFLAWLALPAKRRWLDVGCGTGALSEAILRLADPAQLLAIDRSEEYIQFAQRRLQDERVELRVGDAQSLPVENEVFDCAVSGLMLNFVPDARQAVGEMARAVQPGGVVAAYVWDYAGKMQLMRHFWNAAAALNPAAAELDEGRRFPLCDPAALEQLFRSAGLRDVQAQGIEIATDFRDFEDYWQPFAGGQGPAPGYTVSLSESDRLALRERLRGSLPTALDGSIPLVARAWAVRGLR